MPMTPPMPMDEAPETESKPPAVAALEQALEAIESAIVELSQQKPAAEPAPAPEAPPVPGEE